MNKEEIKKELDKLIDIREDFYGYFDKNLKNDTKNGGYDFSSKPTLDAKEVYEHFFKLDYQARKLRGLLFKVCDLKAE